MKLCVMSDTHLSATKYSKVDKRTGLNRFYVRQFETFEWILNYLKENNINTIVHCGDVFDSARVTSYTIDKTKKMLEGFDVYAIKGNHDDSNFYHDNEFSALELLDIHAYNSPNTCELGGCNFVFVPWGYEIDSKLLDNKKKNVLVAHGFPKNYGTTNLPSTSETNVGDVLSNKTRLFDLVLTGHWHMVDKFNVGKTSYLNPGSISNFGNDDTPLSIWILDTDNLSYEQVKIPCAIRIRNKRGKDLNRVLESVDTEDIYRIKTATLDYDRKILLQAKKIALDVQLKADKQQEEHVVENVSEFWQYVKDNKEAYEKDFRQTLVDIGA